MRRPQLWDLAFQCVVGLRPLFKQIPQATAARVRSTPYVMSVMVAPGCQFVDETELEPVRTHERDGKSKFWRTPSSMRAQYTSASISIPVARPEHAQTEHQSPMDRQIHVTEQRERAQIVCALTSRRTRAVSP